MVGNRLHGVVLGNMVARDQVPPALLFAGPSGVGKTTAARILATSLEATDVIEVDGASNGGVDAIRKLLDVTRYSTGGGKRVLILDEAQSITRQGFEALLKVLEEPPPDTIFVLCSTQPWKIDDTILSRVLQFDFFSVSENDVLGRLSYIVSQEGLDVEIELLRYLAQRAQGNVRSAVQSLDQAVLADANTLTAFVDLAGEHDTIPVLVAALTTGDHARVFAALDQQLTLKAPGRVTAELIACVVDLLVIKAGGEPRASGSAKVRRQRIAERVDREALLLVAKILWDAQTALRASEDARGTLELSLVLIAGAFNRVRDTAPQVASPQSPSSKPMTLAEMQQAARKEPS
jgi:DNA polymerase-3 subunit gamma/tau